MNIRSEGSLDSCIKSILQQFFILCMDVEKRERNDYLFTEKKTSEFLNHTFDAQETQLFHWRSEFLSLSLRPWM